MEQFYLPRTTLACIGSNHGRELRCRLPPAAVGVCAWSAQRREGRWQARPAVATACRQSVRFPKAPASQKHRDRAGEAVDAARWPAGGGSS